MNFGCKVTTVTMVGLVTLLFASCSSGGDSNGFCRRWSDITERATSGDINSTEELLSAISKTSLGDPGGLLSDLRDGFEAEIRNGTNERALYFTEQIFDTCAELK